MTESLHGDLASFVANALSPEEDAAFAEHLAGCRTCQDELVWLSELAVAVADLGPADPGAADLGPAAEVPATAGADAAVVAFPAVPVELDRSAVRPDVAPVEPVGGGPPARQRWLAGWLAAAAVVLLALGGAAGYLAGHATSRTVVAAREDPAQQLFDTGTVHRAGDPSTRVNAEVAVTPSPGGVNVGLRLSDPVGPKKCELVVVGRDGEQQTAMTWSVPAGGFGAGSAQPLLARGQAGLRPDQIARFEVRSSGRTLLVIPA